MPDLIWFQYSVIIDDKQERTGDEPRFEVFFVNIFNNVARATVVDTGILEVNVHPISNPSSWDNTRARLHPPLIPTADNPYLAMVVRAFEHDDITAGNRMNSQDAVLARIEEMYNPMLRAGARPRSSDLWVLVNGAAIPSGGDVDERIGVSVREYPNFGRDLNRDGRRRTIAPAGRSNDMFEFNRHSAIWRMPFFFSHQFLAD